MLAVRVQRFVLVDAAPRRCERAVASAAQDRGATALAGAVDAVGSTTRALIVGAHPDDEDTRLITWLARGRHVETAYLSLTRGDGGQNLIGNELGEALGAIRTEELLAARRLDGGRQYFSRAYDFGFSKSADETFEHWPQDSVLGDVVRVVRAFRPHVLDRDLQRHAARRPRTSPGVSGILAREAYDAAARHRALSRARRFGPARGRRPKFYRSTSYRNHVGATLSINVGEYDPVLGPLVRGDRRRQPRRSTSRRGRARCSAAGNRSSRCSARPRA